MSSPVVDIVSLFHDADLLGIDFGNQVKLRFKTADLKKVGVTLVCAKHLVCNNLKEGNIVLEFAITRNSKLTTNLTEIFFNIRESFNPKLQDHIDKINTDLLEGRLLLVSISPSYGCELYAICENVIFDELK